MRNRVYLCQLIKKHLIYNQNYKFSVLREIKTKLRCFTKALLEGVIMPDYKLSLSPELDRKLQEIAEKNNLDINQLLLNAVSVYSQLKDNTKEEGTNVDILDKENKAILKVNIP